MDLNKNKVDSFKFKINLIIYQIFPGEITYDSYLYIFWAKNYMQILNIYIKFIIIIMSSFSITHKESWFLSHFLWFLI